MCRAESLPWYRLAASIAVLLVCARTAGTAQPLPAAIAGIRTLDLRNPASHSLVESSQPDRQSILVWDDSVRVVRRIVLDGRGRVLRELTMHAPVPFSFVATSEYGRNEGGALFLVDRPGRRIAVVRRPTTDPLVVTKSIPIPFEPEQVVAGDFTNDGLVDLLVANRDVPGILPLIARANGSYVERPLVAPDNPVGAFALADLNGDGLKDVVLYDWVKSELVFWYGAGRGRMIEQSIFPVNGNVNSIVAGKFISRQPSVLLLAGRDASDIQIWADNGLGQFSVAGVLPVTGHPVRTAFADMNGDGWMDVVALTDSSTLEVMCNDHGTGFVNRVRIGVPEGTTGFSILPRPRGPGEILLPVRGARTAMLIGDGAMSLADADSLDLVTGRLPVAAISTDLNRDGRMDIVTACYGTRSLLVTWGGSDGWQRVSSFGLTISPQLLAEAPGTDSTARFLVGSREKRTVAVVSFEDEDSVATEDMIPTEGRPRTIDVRVKPRGGAEYAVVNDLSSDELSALSLYERVGPSRYLERSFRLPKPDIMLGAAVADVDADGMEDIVYAYRPENDEVVELGLALGDSAMTMRNRSLVGDIPDSLSRSASVWTVESRNHTLDGVLVWLPKARPNLWFQPIPHDGDSVAAMPLSAGADIAGAPVVRVTDLDGDGRTDIVISAREVGGIGWFRGGRSGFEPFRLFIANPSLVNFDVVRGPDGGLPEILATMQNPDRLRMYSGKWVRRNIQ